MLLTYWLKKINMLYFLCIVFLSLALSCRILKYNTKYCISKPHYLSLTGPLHMAPSKKSIPEYNDYEIPRWIEKKVFPQNIPPNKRK